MKIITIFITALTLILVSATSRAQGKNKVVVIPLSSTEMVKATPETIVSASGDWNSAGLVLPAMILKDLIIFAESVTSSTCQFTMNYVINNAQSRTIRRFTLGQSGSVQISFGAGVNTSDLRFGTIIPAGGGSCSRNWAAFGVEVDG